MPVSDVPAEPIESVLRARAGARVSATLAPSAKCGTAARRSLPKAQVRSGGNTPSASRPWLDFIPRRGAEGIRQARSGTVRRPIMRRHGHARPSHGPFDFGPVGAR